MRFLLCLKILILGVKAQEDKAL